jgi:hypothetical protein
MVPPVQEQMGTLPKQQRHSVGKSSDAYTNQAHGSQKDFFNSTAPINMSKLFGTKVA